MLSQHKSRVTVTSLASGPQLTDRGWNSPAEAVEALYWLEQDKIAVITDGLITLSIASQPGPGFND